MRSVGIDIGTNQVKVVEVQTTSKSFQLVRAQTKNLSRATGTDLELEVIEFLREISAQYDATTTRFCVALRQDKVAVRNKTFPFSDRQRIQKTLPFEMEDELPFSSENAIFEGKIVRSIGPTSEVLASAAPKIQVAHLVQLMRDSSIDPYLISTEGAAFANLFERWNDPIPAFPPPPVIAESFEAPHRPIRVLLNIGHTRTLVCAFDGNMMVGVRSILWGGRDILTAIAQKYSLAPADAQKEMELKAFILTSRQDASYESKIFSDVIAKSVRDLVRDIQMSMLEFKSEFNGVITEVQLTGGVSAIQGLGPYLTQHLEVPCNPISILDLFPNVLFERTSEANLRYGLAIGLAIEGLRKPRNPPMNFMKHEFARQTSFGKDLWADWKPFAASALAVTVLLCIWSYGRGIVGQDLDSASEELLRNQAKVVAKLPAKQANEAGVKRFIKENRKKIADIRTLESLAGMNSAMDVLSKISSSVPDGKSVPLDVTELAISDNTVRLAGFVRGGKDLVDRLSQSLANMAEGGRVTMDGVQPSTGKTGFRFSFRVDRNIQKVTK